MDFVDHFLKTKPLVALFDSVLIPVITSAGTDHRQGLLEGDQLEHVQQGVIDIMDAVSPDTPIPDETGIRVACVPARAHRDRLAGEMLMRLLLQKGHAVRSAVAKMPLVDLIGWIREAETDVVCISVIAPTTLIHARYLCSKLRAAFPELRIIVGLWGNAGLTEEAVGPLRDSGADEIVTTLAEALERVADHPQQAQSIAEMPGSVQ
jgi:hypothetical protein